MLLTWLWCVGVHWRCYGPWANPTTQGAMARVTACLAACLLVVAVASVAAEVSLGKTYAGEVSDTRVWQCRGAAPWVRQWLDAVNFDMRIVQHCKARYKGQHTHTHH